MQEIDNRKIADSFAEFITPIPLREFLKKEVGDCKDKTIFDCAVGSGQLLYNNYMNDKNNNVKDYFKQYYLTKRTF